MYNLNGARDKGRPSLGTNLKERREDDSACISKFKGGEQLRQDLVFTEVFREGVQMVTQILKELLLLCWLLYLEGIIRNVKL